MAHFNDASALAKAQLGRARAAHTRLRVGHYRMCAELYDEGKALLGGQITVKELIRMGHPYGRRAGTSGKPGRQRRIKGGKGVLPALPINAQTNRLREALNMRHVGQGNKQTYELKVNKGSVPYAKYILSPSGTRKMVTRPFWATLQKSWRKRNFDLLVRMRAEQRGGN